MCFLRAATDPGAALQELLRAALGRPHRADVHLRDDPPPWSALFEEALGRGSVHILELVEALHRTDPGTDTLARSVAVQWLDWR